MRAVQEINNPEFILESFTKSLDLVRDTQAMIDKVNSDPEMQLRVRSDPNTEMVERYYQMVKDTKDPTKIICPEYPMNQLLTAILAEKKLWHWFDLGSFGAQVLNEQREKDTDLTCGPEWLPFPHTLFTFYFDSENLHEVQLRHPIVSAVFCRAESDEEIAIAHFMSNTKNSEFRLISTHLLAKMDGKWMLADSNTLVGDPTSKSLDENVTDTVAPTVVVQVLRILSCNNVQVCEHKPTFQALSKAKRLNRTRPYTRHTLVISGDRKTSGMSLGGTHASPALHFRRGHVRQYAPGKYTWVTSTMVGNASRGEVITDYKIEANRG